MYATSLFFVIIGIISFSSGVLWQVHPNWKTYEWEFSNLSVILLTLLWGGISLCVLGVSIGLFTSAYNLIKLL